MIPGWTTNRRELIRGLAVHAKSLYPLFRYLVLQTETHAFCLALACATLIGFYPFCVLLLSFMKHALHWDGGYTTLQNALEIFFPATAIDQSGADRNFLLRNLDASVSAYRRGLDIGSVFWVFLGAAGVFIPLEAGLNRLWKVQADRPYLRNQFVGLTLTVACCFLALAFVAINNLIQTIVGIVPIHIVQVGIDRIVLHLTAAAFFSITLFLFYKVIPNRKVDTLQVLPAAILAGVAAELVKDIYVLVLPLMDIGSSKGSQGPFYISVSFVVLGYFETFVILGGAFLATQTEAYPWLGFIRSRQKEL